MQDAKEIEIHDLRNNLMNTQMELLLFRQDVFRVYESLRELLNRYQDKGEKSMTVGGGNAI